MRLKTRKSTTKGASKRIPKTPQAKAQTKAIPLEEIIKYGREVSDAILLLARNDVKVFQSKFTR